MKRQNLYLIGIILFLLIQNAPFGAASQIEQDLASKEIQNLQLIYSSNQFNEVPFFGSGSVLVESGDNHNDFLVVIPFWGYDITPGIYRDLNRFTELENPRPDVPDGKKLSLAPLEKTVKKQSTALMNSNLFTLKMKNTLKSKLLRFAY